jgi:hypothetical protein
MGYVLLSSKGRTASSEDENSGSNPFKRTKIIPEWASGRPQRFDR